jgi:hypothetical protein
MYCYDDPIKADEKGKAFGTNGGDEKFVQNFGWSA